MVTNLLICHSARFQISYNQIYDMNIKDCLYLLSEKVYAVILKNNLLYLSRVPTRTDPTNSRQWSRSFITVLSSLVVSSVSVKVTALLPLLALPLVGSRSTSSEAFSSVWRIQSPDNLRRLCLILVHSFGSFPYRSFCSIHLTFASAFQTVSHPYKARI